MVLEVCVRWCVSKHLRIRACLSSLHHLLRVRLMVYVSVSLSDWSGHLPQHSESVSDDLCVGIMRVCPYPRVCVCLESASVLAFLSLKKFHALWAALYPIMFLG